MPIDALRCMRAPLRPRSDHWDATRIILYHLGIGAGQAPGDPRELAYVYQPRLRPLPTFAMSATTSSLHGITEVAGITPGPRGYLHAEHRFSRLAPLPSAAEVQHTGRVTGIWPRGSSALVEVTIHSRDSTHGTHLCENRYRLLMPDTEVVGAPPVTPAEALTDSVPARTPDATLITTLPPQAGLIYRLLGDHHPLHVDPDVARRAGFEGPILPGLCTLGAVCKAICDSQLEGDVERLTGTSARFTDVIYPGETLHTQVYFEGGRVRFRSRVEERDSVVLDRAEILLTP